MWEGLMALKALPDETRLYCGHEYTLANCRFALSVEPQNAALQASITRQMEAAVTEAADAKKMAETARAEAESAKKKWERMAKACNK